MFDVIVVGGGPAGLSAALMLGRCRRSVLVCDLAQPRNRRSCALHGYLTRDGVAPAAFIDLGRGELTPYGVQLRRIGVTGACWTDGRFRVTLAEGQEEEARFLLLATGVIDDQPLVPGFDDCYGRSVFHCPYCDGWEWSDRRFAAMGRPFEASRLALGLTNWSRDVLLCTHGRVIARRERERLERNGLMV